MKENLTEYQRLNLVNQYKILRDLAIIRKDEFEIEKYDTFVTILTEGYIGEYSNFTEELSNQFPSEESELVWKTLEIYSYIQFSYRKIKHPSFPETKIYFDGFDGNEEGQYYAFCKFILFTLKRFGEFTENGRTDFNSHSNRCQKYRAMVNKWEEMGKPYELSEGDIKKLLCL